MKPFWPGVIGMSAMGAFGTLCLYATFSYDHVAAAVPAVGFIWTTIGFGAAIYFFVTH